MKTIDYSLISAAVSYYSERGFEYINVPWIVDPSVSRVTLDEDVEEHHVLYKSWSPRGSLIGSAEQGFIQLINEEKLKYGKYMAVSPCFRDDEEDELHTKQFVKVELIHIDPDRIHEAYTEILSTAFNFFSGYIGVATKQFEPHRHDIVSALGDVELGSYGVRHDTNFGRWIYGTGCAEPRFSTLLGRSASSFP